MGLLNRKNVSLQDIDETSTFQKRFEEIKNTPLPTRRIINVCAQSCCGCGCFPYWFHVVVDPDVDLDLKEDTYFNSFSDLDNLANTNGVHIYEGRFTDDPNSWNESDHSRYDA